MLSDVAWRKMPTDLLTNENMTYIESQMPKGFEYAPFMFYQAALKKADNDGIFDIEDGVIFARLMRVPSPAIVFKIVNLMGNRRMIYRESTSTLCYLADWEYTGGKSRTLSERRAIVQQKIREMESMPKAAELRAKQEEELPPFEPFAGQSADDDKNAKNVVKNTMDDKNAVNCRNVEREKDREIEREIHTQRDRESVREEERIGASAEIPNVSATAPMKEKKPLAKDKKTNKKTDVIPEPFQVTDTSSLVNEALHSKNNDEKKTGPFLATIEQLDAFFVSKSFGYDIKKGKRQVEKVAENILNIQSDEPVEKITAKICAIFLKMHESEGPWKDIPLQPSLLNKPSVWVYILSQLGKQLKRANSNSISKLVKEFEEKAKLEEKELENDLAVEYRKYGIDPADPQKSIKLLQAKSAEQSKNEEAEDIPIPANEIF